MGSQRQATQPQGSPPLRIMDINLDFLKPLYELVQNEEVQRKMEETARLYWSPDVDDNTVTVNLIPSVIALIIAALIALPLLGVPIFSLLGDSLFGVWGSIHRLRSSLLRLRRPVPRPRPQRHRVLRAEHCRSTAAGGRSSRVHLLPC